MRRWRQCAAHGSADFGIRSACACGVQSTRAIAAGDLWRAARAATTVSAPPPDARSPRGKEMLLADVELPFDCLSTAHRTDPRTASAAMVDVRPLRTCRTFARATLTNRLPRGRCGVQTQLEGA